MTHPRPTYVLNKIKALDVSIYFFIHMYNPKNKTRLFIVSSIATMLVEIQSKEKKWGQEKSSEAKRTIQVDFFENCPFWCIYKKKFNTFIFWSTLGLHLVRSLRLSKLFFRSQIYILNLRNILQKIVSPT